MWNPFDFTGKKIIVAGATSGMGRVTAVKLSEQGAEVCLIGRSQDKLNEVKKELSAGSGRCYVKDFNDPGNFQEIFDDIIADGKKIDGLVYCAGIAKVIPLTALSYNNMDECMRVNFYSFVDMLRLFMKKKYHNDGASAVAISSIAAQYPGKCQNIYSASKAALNVMVQSLAMELAEKGIRINTVMPASTNTRMFTEAIENRGKDNVDRELDKQLLGLEEPEDIADIIMFLLSDASRKITGRAIYADAGYLNL